MITAQLSLSNPSASNNTTPVTPPSEVPKRQKPESNHTSNKKTSESRATTTKSTSTTATAKPQQNTSTSTTSVNSLSKSAESSLMTPRASISTSTVDVSSEEVSRKTNTKSSFTLTTAESSLSSFSASTSPTSVISPSGTGTLTVVLVVVGSGVTVGAILLVLAVFRSKRRTGAEKLNKQERKEQDFDIYHPYATIAEKPAAPVSQDMTYSMLQNFTATELLLMSHHSSPAEVKVRCFYTGDLNSTSADSEPSSITIQSQTPQMSVQHFNGEHVRFVCSLPGSVKDDTRCNLYFGEASHSVLTVAVGKKSKTKNKQRFCQFYVSIDDFLRHLHFVQQKDASCDYTLKREPRSLSPRSDRYNLTAILESESPKINKPSSIMTTESSLSKLSASTSTSVNSITGLGTRNLNPTTGVNTPVKTTQYITSRDSTTSETECINNVKIN
ncbi:serine-rich adhesin for platelets-like [Pundamilia nyererei]|uniref:Serine-rich adhesin for platelets-like n=1 Tax=Pundamilia nyererei TaxID=303518 RepID=A0A9Y3RKT0_9CICH|nr:PREDICTED: serine-rich adhesin for platelets-like [Pundamilia nyererei]